MTSRLRVALREQGVQVALLFIQHTEIQAYFSRFRRQISSPEAFCFTFRTEIDDDFVPLSCRTYCVSQFHMVLQSVLGKLSCHQLYVPRGNDDDVARCQTFIVKGWETSFAKFFFIWISALHRASISQLSANDSFSTIRDTIWRWTDGDTEKGKDEKVVRSDCALVREKTGSTREEWERERKKERKETRVMKPVNALNEIRYRLQAYYIAFEWDRSANDEWVKLFRSLSLMSSFRPRYPSS